MAQQRVRGQRRELTGTVVSNRMDKTIVVQVTRRVMHRMYKKYITRRDKYKAHDKNNDCGVGDVVTIRESRPLSKEKRWRLVAIRDRARI